MRQREKRQEKQEAAAERLAEKMVPIVPHGAVNDRPPAIDEFKRRMAARMRKMTTHAASEKKYEGKGTNLT